MNYDRKYPNARVNTQYGRVFRCVQDCPCRMCGKPTHWTDAVYGVSICSEEHHSLIELSIEPTNKESDAPKED